MTEGEIVDIIIFLAFFAFFVQASNFRFILLHRRRVSFALFRSFGDVAGAAGLSGFFLFLELPPRDLDHQDGTRRLVTRNGSCSR